MNFNEDLDIMLSVGWLVHPIDNNTYGVHTSPQKVESRFKEIKKHFKNAKIEKSPNPANGDYIVKVNREN